MNGGRTGPGIRGAVGDSGMRSRNQPLLYMDVTTDRTEATMRNRSPKVFTLSALLAACLGAGMFGLAGVHRTGHKADSDELSFTVGPERQRAVKLIAARKGLSEREAQKYLKVIEQRKRLHVLNKFSLPNGTVADFVKVSGGPKPVQNQGCGVLLNPRSELGRRYFEQATGKPGTPGYRYFLKKWEEAEKQGVFNWTLTPKQREQLLRASRGETGVTRSRQTPVALRTLVVAVEFPQWVDAAPAYSTTNPRVYYSTAGQPPEASYFHPISDQDNDGLPDRFQGQLAIGETPGGPVVPNFNYTSGSTFVLGGLNWSAQTHPGVRGQTYPQSVDLREQWYSILFDPVNANSVVNYYWQNSHGHVRLSGDRSDIMGWLETRHPLDRTDIAPGSTPFYAFPPGTPLIRPIPEPTGDPVLAYASVNTSADPSSTNQMVNSWITVVWSRPASDILGATSPFLYRIESPPGIRIALGSATLTSRVDPFDPRRVVMFVTTGGNAMNASRYWSFSWKITFDNTAFGGTVNQSISGYTDWGPFLPNDTYTEADVMQTTGPSNPSSLQATLTPHRLKSYCYYTTEHQFRSGDPYQLAHLRNRLNRIDDIGGNVDDGRDHVDRPAPYDHDLEDHNRPTGGILGYYPHDVTGLKEDINALLADNGVDVSQYDRIVYVYPSPAPSGVPAIVANGSNVDDTIMVPETATLQTIAANLGFTFGFPNLFDGDRGAGYNPPHRITHAVGPYSLMSGEGIRLDPYCKLIADPGPWIDPIVVTSDRLGQRIPEVEGVYDESRVLWINVPSSPTGKTTGEYFLVENHNRHLFGDDTPLGLTIFHIDPRYGLFYYPDLPPNSGGQNDDLWLVAVEQADGQYELERKLVTQSLTTLDTDSFGADTASGVTVWDQYNTDLAGNPRTTSRSRGLADADGNLQPGTAFDSYIRIANISNTGSVMTADIYVEPRELIVTGTPVAPPTVQQGAQNVPMLQLDFSHSPASMNDVTIDSLKLNESGSSKLDSDVTRVSLFDDSNGVSGFQPNASGSTPADRPLASTTFTNQTATFTGLSYLVKHGETRRMFVTFDISETMDTSAQATVGVEIARPEDIRPKIPGAIQERAPNGQFRFPIPQGNAATSKVVEAGDTLLVTPTSRAPASVTQGAQDVPMLSLDLSVNRDSVLITRLQVREDGTSDEDTDLIHVKLYEDPEQDGAIGVNDTLIAQVPLSGQTADFQGLSYVVTSSATKSLLVAYDVSDFAHIGKTLTAALADVSAITLGDATDSVSVANFPIASNPSLIGRAAHNLHVTASSLVLPFVDPGQVDVPVEKLVLTPDVGVITLKGLRISQTGTGTLGASGDLKRIKVYRDTNQSGLLETTGANPDELLVSSDTFVDTDVPADGNIDGVVFTSANGSFPANFTINAGSSETLFIAVDVGDPGVAKVGNTIDLALASAASIDATPDTTLLSTGSFPVESGPSIVRGLVTAVIGDSVVEGTQVPQGALEQMMARLDVTALDNDVTLDTLVISRGGSGTDADVLQAKAYLDVDLDQILNGGVDTLLGAAPFTSGQVIFSGLDLKVLANQTVSLFIVYDISGNAQANVTLTAQLLSSGAISGPGVQVSPSVLFPLSSNSIVVADAPPRLESCEASQDQAVIRFSEPVQQAEAEQATNLEIESPPGTLIHSAGSPMPGLELKYDSATHSLQLSGLAFAYGDKVEFRVFNVMDLAGNVIAAPNNTCTTTAGATVAPSVASCVVDETGTARITYSKDVRPEGAGASPADLSHFSFLVNGVPLSIARASLTYDSASRTTTLTGLDVQRGDAYQLTVTGVTDVFGNTMTEDGVANVCSGTVADALPPTLSTMNSHANGVVLAFSEPLDPTTAAVAGNYQITAAGSTVAIDKVLLNSAGDTVTLVPATGLTLTSSITVTIKDVTDLAGRVIDPNPTVKTSSVGFAITFRGYGLTLFSVPMILDRPGDPSDDGNNDPERVLGAGAKVARFDPVLSRYQLYPTTKFGFVPGEGYWARFNTDTALLLSGGELVSTLVPFPFTLPTANWTLFGNPFLSPLSWNVDALKVRFGGVEVPLRQLVNSASPAMETYAWGYDPLARDYYLIGDPSVIPGVTSLIPVGAGVWLKSNAANVVLMVPPPTTPPAPPRATRFAADYWSVELIARSGDLADRGNLLGVSRGRAVTVQSPPPTPDQSDFVELSFVSGHAGPSVPVRSEVDLRDSLAPHESWEVEVRTDRAGDQVQLTWPELSRVPNRYRLRLVDLLTGRVVAMRTSRSYTFGTNRSGITTRRFRVELTPAAETGLRLSNVAVTTRGRGPNAGLSISYVLSRDAEVQIRVLSPSGRAVGTANRMTGRAGANRAFWSGRQASGSAMTRGVYLVEITARDDEGQATRAVRIVPVH